MEKYKYFNCVKHSFEDWGDSINHSKTLVLYENEPISDYTTHSLLETVADIPALSYMGGYSQNDKFLINNHVFGSREAISIKVLFKPGKYRDFSNVEYTEKSLVIKQKGDEFYGEMVDTDKVLKEIENLIENQNQEDKKQRSALKVQQLLINYNSLTPNEKELFLSKIIAMKKD